MGSKASHVSFSAIDGKNKESKSKDEWLERVEIGESEKREDVVRIVLVSDTHNRHRKLQLPEGDILIHAGDFTNNGTRKEIEDFDNWLASLDQFQHKILVPGNHDTGTEEKALLRDASQRKKQGESLEVTNVENATVLRGEMVHVIGLKVFGLPDTLDPYNLLWWAYRADTEEEMKVRAEGISDGVDVLISHMPPFGVGDTCHTGQRAGSRSLREVVLGAEQPPKLWAFGHIHECGGRAFRAKGIETVMVNAASCPLLGKGLRPPIVIDICKETKKVLGVTVFDCKTGADDKDPHPMDSLFNKNV